MKKKLIISLCMNALFVLVIVSLLYLFVIPYQPFKNLKTENIVSAMACEIYGDKPIYPLSEEMKQALVELLQEVKLDRVSREEPTQSYLGGMDRFVVEMINGKTIAFGAYSDWCFLINGKYYTAKQLVPLKALSEIHNDARAADHRYKHN